MKSWSIDSWTRKTYEQAPDYPCYDALQQAVQTLQQLPPLVSSGEINSLKTQLAKAGRGEAFILQGGDCAESFADCRSETISNKLKILLQMSLILTYGMRKPIIRIGRIAGQYAKPRSSNQELIDGISLPSYRGDLVNSPEFTLAARTPNPQLLLQGYGCAAMTLNFIRSLLSGGFADLHHAKHWDLHFIKHSKQAKLYQHMTDTISDALNFLNTIDGLHHNSLHHVDFYTSHEALHLYYEHALTREIPNEGWYNLSTHLPWLGMRTATLNSAHVEFLRGIKNPIGIKIGPQTTPEWLVEMAAILNPKREEGRLLLITRLGAKTIQHALPPLIKAIQQSAIPVTWSCDPMHGNTEMTEDGIKTRHFDTILQELKQALIIHRQYHSYLGGVHFELTGENVTECVGGACGLAASDLTKAYHSLVDPRLNYEQSLEMAIQLSHAFNQQ